MSVNVNRKGVWLPLLRINHNRVRILAITALMAGWAHVGFADAPTLFQWSYGGAGEGGPDPNEPLITDRPDFTESSVTVGRGVVQLESGYTYFYDSDVSQSLGAHTYPEALLRVGVLADWLELRFFYSYAEETNTIFGVSRDTVNGSEDLGLGLKFALTGQAGILPEMALVPQMRVPTGSSDFTAGEVLPGLNWLYGWDLTDRFSVGGQTQANRRLDDVTTSPYVEMSQSFTFNISLTDQLGSYVEWFVLAPDGADTNPTEDYFDGGLTFKVTDNLQLDVRAGVGLNSDALDLFTGLGFALRL